VWEPFDGDDLQVFPSNARQNTSKDFLATDNGINVRMT
jgi:hypothetical protein